MNKNNSLIEAFNQVAYHPLSHLEIHEEDGLKEMHHIESVQPISVHPQCRLLFQTTIA